MRQALWASLIALLLIAPAARAGDLADAAANLEAAIHRGQVAFHKGQAMSRVASETVAAMDAVVQKARKELG